MKSANRLSSFFEQEDTKILKNVADFKHNLDYLRYEGSRHRSQNAARTWTALRLLKKRLTKHIAEEENVLFPFVWKRLPRLKMSQYLFLSEHMEFRNKIDALEHYFKRLEAQRSGRGKEIIVHEIYSQGVYLACLVISHLRIENAYLYKNIQKELKAVEQKELKRILRLKQKREKSYDR